MTWKPNSAGWRVRARIALLVLVANLPASSFAGDVYYRYDNLGRLNRVCNANPTDGELTAYALDQADNRSNYSNQKTDFALYAGSGVSSNNGRFTLWMQSDGNLVLYQNSNGQALWATGTNGSGAGVANFQSNGDLVLFNPSGSVWGSQTYQYPCASLQVQDTGNLAIVSADGQVVWQTGTSGQ